MPPTRAGAGRVPTARPASSFRRGATLAAAGLGLVLLASTVSVETALDTLRTWAETRGLTGLVGFGAAYVVLALLFVPGAALTVVAGAVFGIGEGLVVVAIATSVADAAAFLLGRHVARGPVLRLMSRYPVFKLIDAAISRGGWRIVALVRLNPTIPYSASNYLFGVTGVSLVPFLISSGIFTLPGAFAYLYLGYVGGEALDATRHSAVEWGLIGAGLGLTVVALVYVSVLARRELARLEADRTGTDGLPSAESAARMSTS